jgi:hypothetical protein
MRAIGLLVLLCVLLIVLTFSVSGPHRAVRPAPQSTAKATPSVHEVPADLPVPIRDFAESGVSVLLPSACLPGDGSYDVVIHFHGALNVMKAALSKSELNVALLVVTVGEISGDYADRYAPQGTLEWLLGRVERVVNTQCPLPNRRVRRLGLSAWSAGFAAVGSLLRHPGVFARTDAVLLADGLHAPLLSRSPRTLPPDSLATFIAFAELAVAGKKLFAITHSAVRTDTYASTTESADFLLSHLGLSRTRTERPGPLPGMVLETSVERGGFSLESYPGGDERAHSQHLWALGDTLFRRLRIHWAGAAVPATSASAHVASGGPPVAVSVEVQGNVTCTKSGSYVECRAEQ